MTNRKYVTATLIGWKGGTVSIRLSQHQTGEHNLIQLPDLATSKPRTLLLDRWRWPKDLKQT